MPRVLDSVAFRRGSQVTPSRMWPSPSPYRVGTPGKVIPELDGWPACAPVNASPRRLPASAHDSGSRWFAIPFLCGSCIRDSLPALTGAFMASPDFPILNSFGRYVKRSGERLQLVDNSEQRYTYIDDTLYQLENSKEHSNGRTLFKIPLP